MANRSRTLVRFAKNVRVDPKSLFDELGRLGVPFRYTDELRELYFTFLRNGDHGDYVDSRIRLSCDSLSKTLMPRVLIHELGHHIDEIEALADDIRIIIEKRTNAKYMTDSYARKNVVEYIAVGFEVFYCGSKSEKEKLRKKNPRLYSAISRVHRKYRG